MNDSELQDFIQDVYNARNDGLPGVKGWPTNVDTRSKLVKFITHIIYWMSVNHGLGNLSAFQPLGALGYYSNKALDPAVHRSEHDWFEALPRLNVGMGLFEFTRLFVDLPIPWHRSLGKYPQGNFMHDPRVYPYLHEFQNKMREIDESLRAKNEQRRWAYELRLPSTLTCSPWN